jgi:hypothetical protein
MHLEGDSFSEEGLGRTRAEAQGGLTQRLIDDVQWEALHDEWLTEEQRPGVMARKGSGVGFLFIPSQGIRRAACMWGGNTWGGVDQSLVRRTRMRGIQPVGLVGQISCGLLRAPIKVASGQIWQAEPH